MKLDWFLMTIILTDGQKKANVVFLNPQYQICRGMKGLPQYFNFHQKAKRLEMRLSMMPKNMIGI